MPNSSPAMTYLRKFMFRTQNQNPEKHVINMTAEYLDIERQLAGNRVGIIVVVWV